MKPNYSHVNGIAAMQGVLQASSGAAKQSDIPPIHGGWALQWSRKDNHLTLGYRISALQTMGITIPEKMRDFAVEMGIDCDSK